LDKAFKAIEEIIATMAAELLRRSLPCRGSTCRPCGYRALFAFTNREEPVMHSFRLSGGRTFTGILTKARINQVEMRDVIVHSCSPKDARIIAGRDATRRCGR
jgi:hypothetical protein